MSLRKAGFSVTPAVSVGDALDKLEINPPDLIISETKFATDLDGFELRRRLRGTPEWAEIPFIFLTAETAIENKIKGLELGVDDYLTKPIYIKEIVTRINILLQKRQRQFLDLRKDGTRFAGRVSDMPVVDVIQTIEVSRKSGVIQFAGGPNRQATIYFRDGKVIDAEAGTLQGEDAVYRLLTWNDGDFEVEFRTVRRREVIEASSQGLLMEGMRRLDEWSRLLEQLPPLSHRFEIDAAELSTRLGEVPDDNNRILRLFDGKRTLLEVIDASDFGDLECLQAISRLYFEGLLLDLDPTVRPPRETSKPMPMVQIDTESSGSTPMQRVASGPIDLAGLERASQDEIVTDTTASAPKVGVTMGWDVQADPTAVPEAPATTTSTAPVEASDVIASEPLMQPSELAAATPRGRRDSAQAVDESDVVTEEEVHGPLAGGYRPSSLRLIDEAVAAAQLIEPSLFADDELAALGIKRASSDEVAAAQASAGAPADDSQAAAIARVKLELRTADPRIENARDLVEKTPASETPGANGANGRSARARGKTLPPPIPIKPRKPLQPKELEDAPLLDSALLTTSGEFRIPSDEELEEISEDDLMTSGEIKIPSEQALAAAPGSEPPKPSSPAEVEPTAETKSDAAKTEEIIEVEKVQAAAAELAASEAAAKLAASEAADKVAKTPPPLPPVENTGVPTAILVDDRSGDVDLADEGPTSPSRKRTPISVPVADSLAVKMIGSFGRDRAEAAGELRRPDAKTEVASTQRELVTIMPRRKTGEVAQLQGEDVATLDAKGQAKAKAIVEAVDAKAEADAKAEVPPPASDTKPAAKVETDAKDKDKPAARPALESPPRRVSVEGGVVAPQRGPGVGATVLIILGSLVAGGAVFAYCRKKTTTPVATVQQDAPEPIAHVTPDASDHMGFGVDAGTGPVDAGRIAVTPLPDAAVAQMRPDAAIVAIAPDASTVDAGISKAKEAATLATKARAALAEGEPQAALDLFDESLKLRRDKRTYVDRGRALHNLGKTDEAVASIDQAIAMSESYAPAHEQKGLILWSAQRYGDARQSLEMYLQLVPDGPRADTIRKMLDEPR